MGLALLVSLAACGSDAVTGTDPDPALEPFVGTWDAEVFTVTNDADPTVVADLMINGAFNINIQPSGTYTAILTFGDLSPVVEIGQLTVTGNFATLRPNGPPPPCPATSTFFFTGEDYLTLDGPTCFDFNLDGELEDAQTHIELQRR